MSLADGACLVLARRLRFTAYTADRAWAAVQVPGIAGVAGELKRAVA